MITSVPYATWKTLVQTNGWAHYSRLVETEAAIVYAGSSSRVFKALARNLPANKLDDGSPAVTDYDDWNTTFSGTTTSVVSDDDAEYQIKSNLTAPTSVVQVSGGVGFAQCIERVTSTVNLGSGTWVDVFNIADSCILAELLIHVNSDNLDFRILVNGEEKVLLDLDELHDDYQLRKTGDDDDGGSSVPGSVMVEYASKRWRYRPAVPHLCEGGLQIQLRSQGGTKKLYRAQLLRGEL